MNRFDEVAIPMMVLALCLLPMGAFAEIESNKNSNSGSAQSVDGFTGGREASKVIEAEEVEDGATETETDGECGDADIALGESENEAERLFYLGLAYQYGDHGLNQDYGTAMRLYRKAAEAGSAEAMANIGCMYKHGIGVVSNSFRAAYWFTKAANAGDSFGIHQLAISKAFGIGVERDLAGAKYLLCSNTNYAPSAELLRVLVKEQDITSALALAVEVYDDRIASLECAHRYENKYLAEFDQCNAARYYGAYFYGKEFLVSSRSFSRREEDGLTSSRLRELVNTGIDTNINSIVELARAYANPNCMMQDLAFSEMLYYELLNELSIPDEVLRNELCNEYAALTNEMIAVSYILNQAMNGDVNSMADIGRRYLEGKGVSYNYSESIAWFKAAVEAQRQAAHGEQEDGFRSKALLFVKNNWQLAVWTVFGGTLGCLLYWMALLLIGKICDWWRRRNVKKGTCQARRINGSESDKSDLEDLKAVLSEYNDTRSPVDESIEEEK